MDRMDRMTHALLACRDWLRASDAHLIITMYGIAAVTVVAILLTCLQ